MVSHVNSARTIGSCIRALLAQDYPRELFEVIVVDGGSRDSSISICKQLESEFSNLRLIVLPGCTESKGQMAGVEAARGEVIMFTNSDIYVPKNWMRRHSYWRTKGYDIVGGNVFWGGDKYGFAWNVAAPAKPQHVQQPGLGLGFSNCSVSKQQLVAAGGLMLLKSQHDTEFALRMIKLGGKLILDPEIEVFHDHRLGSMRECFMRSFGYSKNHVIVVRALYGRLICGSGQPTMFSLRVFLKELTLVNGVRVYRKLCHKHGRLNIGMSLFEFIRIRMLHMLGQYLGMFYGGGDARSYPLIHPRFPCLAPKSEWTGGC